MKFDQLKSADTSLELMFGEVAQIEVLTISTADAPKEDSFVFIKNKRFLDKFLSGELCSKLGAIVPRSFYESLGDESKETLKAKLNWLGVVDSVESAMCSLSKPFYDLKFGELNYHVDGRQMGLAQIDPEAEIAQNVFIGEGVKIAANVTIMPGCVIMPNCSIGEGTILYPSVTLYPYSEIGQNCRIHSHTVIGADGFG